MRPSHLMWHAEMALQVARVSLHMQLNLKTTHLPAGLLAVSLTSKLGIAACKTGMHAQHVQDQASMTARAGCRSEDAGQQDRSGHPALPDAVRLRTRLQRYDSPCWIADATALCLPCCLPGSAITCTCLPFSALFIIESSA